MTSQAHPTEPFGEAVQRAAVGGAGHTPGPWFASLADEWKTPGGEHVQFGRIDISAGSVDSEHVDYYRIASVSNVNNSDANRENARVIAAAPLMLDALDHIGGLCSALRAGGPDPMDLQGLSDALHEAVDTAHAAIAKAKGGAQ